MRVQLVGLISDTHGLLRPEAVAALQPVDLILHAGDIGTPEVLERLRAIAPVRAVRGNADKGRWAEQLPQTEVIEIEGLALYMLHDVGALDLEPSVAAFAGVISGHTHRPKVERRDEVLYINPGSAGPRRRGLPLTVAKLRVQGRALEVEVVELEVAEGA